MSRRTQDQLALIYVLFLVAFGVGLILSTLWLFCWLSGPDISSCALEAVNPF